MILGPPSIWLTVNPCDLHDPIAQLLAGEEINLDDFIKTDAPDKLTRAQNIAKDPYAAAKFFHFLICTIIRILFNVEIKQGRELNCGEGIFGELSAYFGTVESQGRGTLHLHMLIWLKDAPTSIEMKQKLLTDEFRDLIRSFIKENMRSHIDGLESDQSVKQFPNETDIAYSRPPHPSSTTYEKIGRAHV